MTSYFDQNMEMNILSKFYSLPEGLDNGHNSKTTSALLFNYIVKISNSLIHIVIPLNNIHKDFFN